MDSSLRQEAEFARLRLAFLEEASRVLSSSLDYESTLRHIAALSVPRLADWCHIHVPGVDGRPQLLAAAHVDPAKEALIWDLDRQYPLAADESSGPAGVMLSGQAELVPEVTDEGLVRYARGHADYLEILRSLGLVSSLTVPMRGRDEIVGTITLLSSTPARRFSEQDVLMAHDLATRAALAIEQARLYGALDEASRAKDVWLANVSHELRTPLTVVLGWLDLLRRREVPVADVPKVLDTIHRNATAQARLIEELLDFARVGTKDLALAKQRLDLRTVVDDVVASLRPAAGDKRLVLTRHDEGASPIVLGDAERLGQVLFNVIGNAIKFTPRGGHIDVSLRAADGEIFVEVRDDGRGIDPSFLPFVFDRLRQEESWLTRRFGGLGLGLAIARQIVELHDGRIDVHSAGRGEGAVFTIRLPSARSGAQSAGAPAPTDVGPMTASLAGRRLLVVEDDPDSRELIVAVLAMAGGAVSAADTWGAALEIAERQTFDTLIIDLAMPEVDGVELLNRLRGLESAQQRLPARALAVTATTDSEHLRRTLAAGFDAFLTKPLAPESFVGTVRDLAGG